MIKERRGGRGNQRGRAGGQRRAISQRRRRAGAVGWEDGVEGERVEEGCRREQELSAHMDGSGGRV